MILVDELRLEPPADQAEPPDVGALRRMVCGTLLIGAISARDPEAVLNELSQSVNELADQIGAPADALDATIDEVATEIQEARRANRRAGELTLTDPPTIDWPEDEEPLVTSIMTFDVVNRSATITRDGEGALLSVATPIGTFQRGTADSVDRASAFDL